METIKITTATNFVRVFRLPDDYPSDFCFGGGHPVTMQLVDWFNPSDQNKEYEFGDDEHKKHIEMLRDFIKGKMYFDPKHTYLLLTDYGDAIVVNPELRFDDLEKQMKAIHDSYDTDEMTN